MIAALQAPPETTAAFAPSGAPAENVRTGLPDAGWTRQDLDRRADWEAAKLKRRKHYAAVYWWLGKVLACVRRSLDDGAWTAWREEHHIDRTKAQRALFFARVFDSPDELNELSIRKADALAKQRLGQAEPPTDLERRLAHRMRLLVRKTLPDIRADLAAIAETRRLLPVLEEIGEIFGQLYDVAQERAGASRGRNE